MIHIIAHGGIVSNQCVVLVGVKAAWSFQLIIIPITITRHSTHIDAKVGIVIPVIILVISDSITPAYPVFAPWICGLVIKISISPIKCVFIYFELSTVYPIINRCISIKETNLPCTWVILHISIVCNIVAPCDIKDWITKFDTYGLGGLVIRCIEGRSDARESTEASKICSCIHNLAQTLVLYLS